MKLLTPHNDISQNELEHLYSSQKSICDDVKLRQLIKRDSLRARKNVGPWKIVHDFSKHVLCSFCFSIDGKYDLNCDRAPILSLVVEDNAGYGTSIAFGLSNKENNYTIRLAIEAV
ncbi:gephyrin: PROVISIONAL [Gigaspora margarita]|uniref:Gephyrin: PROVISIONAL n=1 Tax=Gigaspora margarita TaxID=4874 RepID=A0A8H3X3I5_GIGMA|nr:gephyrin: PROVISIONAL [Gigaspora margarita]